MHPAFFGCVEGFWQGDVSFRAFIIILVELICIYIYIYYICFFCVPEIFVPDMHPGDTFISD